VYGSSHGQDVEVAMKTYWTGTHYGPEEGYFPLDGVEERSGRIRAFAQFHRSRSRSRQQQRVRVQKVDSGVSNEVSGVSRLM
jgi:hypothetical protein